MLQIIMLVVGVYYLYRLATLSNLGLEFGFPPEILAQWRAHKKHQYVWGIVAGWGSLVASLIALFAVQAATRKCYTSYYYNFCDDGDADTAFVWMVVVTAIVLIGGIVLSIMAGNKAKALEQQARAMGMVATFAAQPGWPQPPAAQPGWGTPPTAPQWGAPPPPTPQWPQPPAAQPGWGTPPTAPQWGAPPPPPPPAAPPPPTPGPKAD